MAFILLWSSAVRVHNSQVHRKMDVIRERISHMLALREILLSFQTGFSLVNAAVVCAILESISDLEPSSVMIEPRHLKLVAFSSFRPFTFISLLMPLVFLVISLVFLALIPLLCRLWRLCWDTELILSVLPFLQTWWLAVDWAKNTNKQTIFLSC